MTRYYYDCPLKAGYMAVYHGIRSDRGPARFYVVDECVEMLKFQCGDAVSDAKCTAGVIGVPMNDLDKLVVCWSDERNVRGVDSALKIIQRNGKAFIWPEIEND